MLAYFLSIYLHCKRFLLVCCTNLFLIFSFFVTHTHNKFTSLYPQSNLNPCLWFVIRKKWFPITFLLLFCVLSTLFLFLIEKFMIPNDSFGRAFKTPHLCYKNSWKQLHRIIHFLSSYDCSSIAITSLTQCINVCAHA